MKRMKEDFYSTAIYTLVMCEYCVQHGGGRKWYLEAKNYLRNHKENDRRRKTFVNDFVGHFMEKYDLYLRTNKENLVIGYDNPNWFKRLKYSLYFKYQHAGQVIPLEEAKLAIDIAGQISLLPCVCRFANSGEKHQLCMLFMHIPDDLYGAHRFDRIREVEPLTIEEAQYKVEEFSNKGYVQTIWAFLTPHIGAICNCDYPYCTAVRVRRNTGIKHTLLKAEYVATIDKNSCIGCKQCISKCQFGALNFSIAENKVRVNQMDCFGCGVCRMACKTNSITLIPRDQVPIVTKNW